MGHLFVGPLEGKPDPMPEDGLPNQQCADERGGTQGRGGWGLI